MIDSTSNQQSQGVQTTKFCQQWYCCLGNNVKAAIALGIICLVWEIILTIIWFTRIWTSPKYYGSMPGTGIYYARLEIEDIKICELRSFEIKSNNGELQVKGYSYVFMK